MPRAILPTLRRFLYVDADPDGERHWQTAGRSTDIIGASWLALADSLEWWLMHREPAGR